MASALAHPSFLTQRRVYERQAPKSPCPSEPDVHLRFLFADRVFDYRGCRIAVQNFLRKWSEGHNPAITAVEIVDGFLPDHRMPCEELWLQP